MPRDLPQSPQRIEQRRQNARAARANRMAERDGAALNVDPRGVEAELACHRDGLHGERFVQLDEIDVVDRPADLRQSSFLTASTGVIITSFGSRPDVA